jgi:integrase/recombinase XerD
MPRTAATPVKVLKRIKARGRWILCQAVQDSNGRYNDRVRVEGKIEIHLEGRYYLEWRESGQRRREVVPSQGHVLDHVRVKTLELEAAAAGIQLVRTSGAGRTATPVVAAAERAPIPLAQNLISADGIPAFAQYILNELGLYLQQLAGTATSNSGPAVPPMHFSPVVTPPTPSPGPTSPAFAVPMPTEAPPSTRAEALQAAPISLAVSRVVATTAEPLSPVPLDVPNDSPTIAGTIASFLKDVEPPQREWKTYEEYRNVLHYFRDQCKKVHVKDVVRDDCLEFMRYLYSIGNEERTVYNRIGIVLHWLRLNGIKDILDKRDKPNYVEGRREMYQPEDLEALFRVCAPDEKVRYLFFLLTGERDKEVRYTTWADIDFGRKYVWVTAKKQLKFKPKDKEERKIPVPTSLLEALRQYKERQTGPNPHDLVFPTSQGKPDKKFENKLKRLAHRNGLNCDHCVSKYGNKCNEGPYCGKWFLHKFRHTFATNQLEEGVSIRTLQEWLGHSDLESTMVYLKYVDSKQIHEIVDNTAIARLASASAGCEAALSPAQ